MTDRLTFEPAEVMGLGEAAFKSRLHRARLAVRATIDEYLGELATLRRTLEGLRGLSRDISPLPGLADSVIERLRGQG